MSEIYRPVQWNTNKKAYDILLAMGVVLFLLVDIAASQFSQPAGRTVGIETAIIRALGDAAFVLMTLILSIGPLARLNDRFLPLLYNRRHMGVTLFLIALAHGIIALIWYHGFAHIDPFTSLFTSQGRYDGPADFPFQPLGFIALVIVFLLAATSHDYWNANLGPKLWKALHMGVYGAYALVIFHLALGPLQSEHSGLPDWSIWASLALVGGLHIAAGFQALKGDRAESIQGKWLSVGRWQDIPQGRAKIVMAGGDRVAIFRTVDDRIGAISNACQHQNGPLGEGCLKDGFVTCPWHGFQYRLEDGQAPAPFKEKVPTFRMKADGDELFLDPEPLAPGTQRPLLSFGKGATDV